MESAQIFTPRKKFYRTAIIDNATGNFVKVEQRVTVRLKIDASDELKKLHGGYSVVCKVEE